MSRTSQDHMYLINGHEYTLKEFCQENNLDESQFRLVRNRIYAYRYSNPKMSIEQYSAKLVDAVRKVMMVKSIKKQTNRNSNVYHIDGHNYTIREYCEKVGINDSNKIHKLGAYINNKRQNVKDDKKLSECLVNAVKQELNKAQTESHPIKQSSNTMNILETLDSIPLGVLEEYLEFRHKKNEFDHRRSKINQMLIGEIQSNYPNNSQTQINYSKFSLNNHDPINTAISKLAANSNLAREWHSAEKWVDVIQKQNLINEFFNENEQNSIFVMSMKIGKVLSKYEGRVFDVDLKENGSYKVKLLKQKKSGDANSSQNEYRFAIHID